MSNTYCILTLSGSDTSGVSGTVGVSGVSGTGLSGGHPIRSLRNQMTREYLRLEKEGASMEELELLTLGSLRKAVQEGDVKNGTVMAGQIAGLLKKEQTCREIIEEVMAEAGTLLGGTAIWEK